MAAVTSGLAGASPSAAAERTTDVAFKNNRSRAGRKCFFMSPDSEEGTRSHIRALRRNRGCRKVVPDKNRTQRTAAARENRFPFLTAASAHAPAKKQPAPPANHETHSSPPA